MKLQESGEMYLETILLLSNNNKEVHAIDIANKMGFSKPSVSRAVNKLKDNGYLKIDSNDAITLTKIGYNHASKIYERHLVLTKLFEQYGVDSESAAEDACRVEHVISDKTFDAIKARLK